MQEISATAEEPVLSLEEPTLPEEPTASKDTNNVSITIQNGNVSVDSTLSPTDISGIFKLFFGSVVETFFDVVDVATDVADVATNVADISVETLEQQLNELAEDIENHKLDGFVLDTAELEKSGNIVFKYVNNPSIEIKDTKEEEDDPYKEFVSPQWGFKCPEGYIRLTEYEELTKTDKNAAKQYTLLVNTMQAAKQLRNKEFENAFEKSKIALYSDIDANINKAIEKLFQNAGIKMLEKGAYRLPDGTIVIEDDKHTMIPQFITYQNNAQSQAPTMLRDKSPNYSAFNEQTWPIYTDFETISDYEYYDEGRRIPEVYRGDGCTYVLLFNDISFYDHWFYTSSETALVSKKGTKTTHFYISSAEHLPLDTYYWIHNQVGKKVCRVQVFPPLPENVRKVDYVYGSIPQEIRLSNAGPIKSFKNLEVKPMPKVLVSRYQ
jgi:hypothetical protein